MNISNLFVHMHHNRRVIQDLNIQGQHRLNTNQNHALFIKFISKVDFSSKILIFVSQTDKND